MKRRKFLGKFGQSMAGAAAGGAIVPHAAVRRPRPLMRVHPQFTEQKDRSLATRSSFPRSLDTIFGAAEYMAERVKAMTGRLDAIRVLRAAASCRASQFWMRFRTRRFRLVRPSYFTQAANPALAFDTCVPFGMTVSSRLGSERAAASPWLRGSSRLRYPPFPVGIRVPRWAAGSRRNSWASMVSRA